MRRLNKYISDSGYCSRREADKFIESGQVKVNGETAEIGTKVDQGDRVVVKGTKIRAVNQKVYIAFNKPVGVTCTTDLKDPTNIIDYIGHKERIFPIGRLDKDSQGLIFLTNDGDIVNAILRAGNNHEKEYIVTVDKPITDAFIQKMSQGVPVHDTVTLPCKVMRARKNTFRIILVQGLNRQIRLMCQYLGYNVVTLNRVRIMTIAVNGIPEGQWRNLSEVELKTINELVQDSSNTEEASAVVNKSKVKPVKMTKAGSNRKAKTYSSAKKMDGKQEAVKRKKTPRYARKKKK